MESFIFIKKAKHINEYKIALEFNDGKENIVDFKNFIFKSQHSDIKKYKDVDIFKSFNFKHGEIEWNDYELAFPINDLHLGDIR